MPDVARHIKAVEGKKSPDPRTKSFAYVKEALRDSLICVKLKFVLPLVKQVTNS